MIVQILLYLITVKIKPQPNPQEWILLIGVFIPLSVLNQSKIVSKYSESVTECRLAAGYRGYKSISDWS